jgi:hypothetical protein
MNQDADQRLNFYHPSGLHPYLSPARNQTRIKRRRKKKKNIHQNTEKRTRRRAHFARKKTPPAQPSNTSKGEEQTRKTPIERTEKKKHTTGKQTW